MMSATIVLPGIGGSDQRHWQTLWQARDPAMTRFQPASWDEPDLGDWSEALDRAVAEAGPAPLLVAHSLACLLVVHWAARARRPVGGAFLVAVPDPAAASFPAAASSFARPPGEALPFATLIVASANDPYGSLDYAHSCAAQWQAGLVTAGSLGHVNSESGLGFWQQGADLLAAFRAGTRHR